MAGSSTKKKVGRDLTQGPILKTLLVFALPMMLTQIIQQLYSMVDLMIIGKYVGTVGTVGVSTGGECADQVLPIAQAVATAGQIYIAQLVGAHDDERVKKCIGTMLTLVIGLASIATVLPIIFHVWILNLLNCPAEAFSQARDYMIITCCGLPFVFGYNVVCAILRGMGEAKRPLIFVSIAATVNIFADLFFVMVLKMEAAGTAIATVLSQIGSFTAAYIYMYRRKESFNFSFSREFFHIDGQCLRVLLKLGIPQLIRTSCVHVSQIWMKAHINAYGMSVSATYSVGSKIEKFMNIFVSGIDQSAGAIMGQNIGARKHDRVKKTMHTALACAMVICIVISALFLLIPTQLYGLFTNDEVVKEMGIVYLEVLSVGIFVHAWGNTYKSIITGAGAYKLSLTVGVLDGISRVLVCLLFVNVFHMGYVGYYWGTPLCFFLPGLICLVYFASGKWKEKKLLSEE